MITWEAVAAYAVHLSLHNVLISCSTFQQGWANGGAGTLLYGFIVVWIGNMLQTAVMAEIASM